jgi:hypothetical protein
MRAELVRYIVQASLGIGDEQVVRTHLPSLIAAVECTPNPWQEAQGRRVLAEVFEHFGERAKAIRYLEQTREIASTHGYNELLYIADEALSRHATVTRPRTSASAQAPDAARTVVLTEESQTVLGRLACLAAG